jgi:hypothetical protein
MRSTRLLPKWVIFDSLTPAFIIPIISLRMMQTVLLQMINEHTQDFASCIDELENKCRQFGFVNARAARDV